jgi:hypothetical protein
LIYICIPAHNEEQTVGVVLWKIRQVMADFPRDYQLLVVDDASSDKTPDVLAPYARVLPLTVVRTDKRRGQAAAVEMMLREAVRRSEYPKRDIAITLQADFTQEPDELVALIKLMEAGADIVVGQPVPDPGVRASVRWSRRLAHRLLRGTLPEGVRDPFMGYAAYRVFTLKRAFDEANGRVVHWPGWAGAAELLRAAAPHARRVEALDMVERRERLQRTSRLEPWPALSAVWSLVRARRPEGVATTAELDEAMRAVAARRTSEMALSPRDRSARQERSDRTQRTARRRGTSEGQPRAGAARTGQGAGNQGSREGGAAARAPTGNGARRNGGTARRNGSSGRRNGGGRQNGGTAAAPASEVPAPAPDAIQQGAEGLETVLPPAGVEASEVRRKRSRRRRRPAREDSASDAGAGAVAREGAEDAGEPAGDRAEHGLAGDAGSTVGGEDDVASGDAGSEQDGSAAARTRRRRRGRRGGRRRSGAGPASAANTEGMADVPAEPASAPEPNDEPTSSD